jgi:hypothetical protein
MGAGIRRPVGTAQALLQLGSLGVAHDGSIVGGELPPLGRQESLCSCGGGLIGGSRPASAVVPALVVAPDSTMGPLNLDRGLDDQRP